MPAGAFTFHPSPLFLFLWSCHVAPPSFWCLPFILDLLNSYFKGQYFSDLTYLFADRSRHRHGKRPDISPPQVLPFALVTEELQLSFFLVIQAVAVAHLKPKTSAHVQVQSSIKVNRSRLRYKDSLCSDMGKTLLWLRSFQNDLQRGIKQSGSHSSISISLNLIFSILKNRDKGSALHKREENEASIKPLPNKTRLSQTTRLVSHVSCGFL